MAKQISGWTSITRRFTVRTQASTYRIFFPRPYAWRVMPFPVAQLANGDRSRVTRLGQAQGTPSCPQVLLER